MKFESPWSANSGQSRPGGKRRSGIRPREMYSRGDATWVICPIAAP